MQKLRKNNQGFTIIEVLIVLVIAAVIMLIVFLAVPALQRNSRNNGRRNDVSRVGSAVNEYMTNNNGTVPTTAAQVTALLDNLSQYDKNSATEITLATGGTPAAITDVATMRIVTQRRCGTGGTVTATGASGRNVAIQYAVESSGGGQAVCQDV